MNRRGWTFFAILVGLAVACLVSGSRGLVGLSLGEIAGAGAFAAMGVLSEALASDFRVKSSSAVNSSVTYLPLFACAVLFPPEVTILAGALIALSSDLFVRHVRLWIAAFNASQYVLTLFVATAVYTALGGGSFATGLRVPAFFALAATFYAVNMGIVASFLSVRQGLAVKNVLEQMVGPSGGNLLYDLLASPIALLAAWLYFRLGIGGVFVAMLPLLLLRYTYLHASQLKHANDDLVRVLIKTIETRDPYTSGHSIRVSTLTEKIGQDLGLSRRRVALMKQAALLHDIGKIDSLYATIIGKPHELTARERDLIRTHATKGAELLLQLSAFGNEDLIKGVRHHHERFDGSGYPDGLRGTAIPLFARVIMICDAMDAMLSDRPYRSALDLDHVRRELVRCSGEQFDPEIVRVVIEKGALERACELVLQEPPDAMAHPAMIPVAAGK